MKSCELVVECPTRTMEPRHKRGVRAGRRAPPSKRKCFDSESRRTRQIDPTVQEGSPNSMFVIPSSEVTLSQAGWSRRTQRMLVNARSHSTGVLNTATLKLPKYPLLPIGSDDRDRVEAAVFRPVRCLHRSGRHRITLKRPDPIHSITYFKDLSDAIRHTRTILLAQATLDLNLFA